MPASSKPKPKRSAAKPKPKRSVAKPKPKRSVAKPKRPAAKPKPKTKRPAAKPKPKAKRPAAKPKTKRPTKPKTTYVPKQEQTYVPKQEQTYVPKQEQTYVPKQEPTYVPKQEQTYVPKQEPMIKKENKTIFPPKEDSIPDGKEEDVIFGKTGIASLSGPVSFYYLRPKKRVYEDGNGKYFPLIVLFGDFHRSLEKTCDQCVCSLNKEKGCCYRLSDPEFLQKIDKLASDRHPVDFYTETTITGLTGFEGGMMSDLTTGEMVSCYRHFLRGTEKDKCPTNNIRWQAAETRHSQIGSFDSSFDNNTRHYYNGDDSFVKDLIGEDLTKLEKTLWIEQQLSIIISSFCDLIDEENKEKSFKDFILWKISYLIRSGVFKTIEGFQELLLTLCENDDKHDDNTLNLDKFAKAFFRLLTKENSLIYKQIVKQSYQPFRDINQWIDFYKRSLEFSLISNGTLKRIEKQKLRETFLKLSSILADPTLMNMKDGSNLFNLLHLRTPLLDLYTIARMWKQPTGGNRSSLSFGYFGNYHVENIVELLMSTNVYELVRAKYIVDDSRCQVFDDFTLNVSKELREHNQKID